MPQTDAELIAYRWGQSVGRAYVAAVAWENVDLEHLPARTTDREFGSLVRLGRRQFRYWAERGAGNLPPAG